VAAGALLLSFASVFVKVARVGPSAAGVYRMLVGGVVLLALALVRRERWWAGRRGLAFALGAGVAFGLDLFFWHKSIHRVGPGLATILAAFQVFILAGYGALVLRERVTWRLGIAIPLALAGLFLLVGVDWRALPGDYRWGVVLGLAAAVTYGAYLVLLRQGQARPGRLEPIPNLTIICFVTAAILAAAGLGSGESLGIPDPVTGLVLLAYGLTAQVFAWLLISHGLPWVEAGRAGLLLVLQPFLSFLWDVLFFHRPTDAADALGAGLALAAIYLGMRRAGGPAGGRAVSD
jgi:drug/metabolite transporter (DMT)-like permease